MKLLRKGAFALAICLLGIQLSAMLPAPEAETYITSVQSLGEHRDLLITVGLDPLYAGGAGEVQADDTRFISVRGNSKRPLRKPIPLTQQGTNIVLVVVDRNTKNATEFLSADLSNLVGKNQKLVVDATGNITFQQDI